MAAELSSEREASWARVYPNLLQYAIPDSRFDYDFSSFAPDFRGSSSAIDRIADMVCYQSAQTILIAPDNSLEQLRHRALKDGKKVLVATHKLRRGFILLDPKRISDNKLEMASWLDGMERPGIGRHLTLTQIEGKVDMCVTGVLAVSGQGVILKRSPQYFELQWSMLLDRGVLDKNTVVIAVAHSCQVVTGEDEVLGKNKAESDGDSDIYPDFIVTPEKSIEINGAERPGIGIQFDKLDQELLSTIPTLQELRGIQMMEQIMKRDGFSQKPPKSAPKTPSADELLGISMVERIMAGYKA